MHQRVHICMPQQLHLIIENNLVLCIDSVFASSKTYIQVVHITVPLCKYACLTDLTDFLVTTCYAYKVTQIGTGKSLVTYLQSVHQSLEGWLQWLLST